MKEFLGKKTKKTSIELIHEKKNRSGIKNDGMNHTTIKEKNSNILLKEELPQNKNPRDAKFFKKIKKFTNKTYNLDYEKNEFKTAKILESKTSFNPKYLIEMNGIPEAKWFSLSELMNNEAGHLIMSYEMGKQNGKIFFKFYRNLQEILL